MQIEIGETYIDDLGRHAKIMGPTKDNPEWFYSLQGDWYTIEGLFIRYSPTTGKHYVLEASSRNLKARIIIYNEE